MCTVRCARKRASRGSICNRLTSSTVGCRPRPKAFCRNAFFAAFADRRSSLSGLLGVLTVNISWSANQTTQRHRSSIFSKYYELISHTSRFAWLGASASIRAARVHGRIFPARSYASAGTSHGPVSVCVCLSVCHKSEFYRKGWTNRAGFGVGASFRPSYTVLKGNSGISKNKGIFLWNFFRNCVQWKFVLVRPILIVETCYRISSIKVDVHSVINWTELTIPVCECDDRPPVITMIIKLCVQHDSVRGSISDSLYLYINALVFVACS